MAWEPPGPAWDSTRARENPGQRKMEKKSSGTKIYPSRQSQVFGLTARQPQ